jgi:hypothetical protein
MWITRDFWLGQLDTINHKASFNAHAEADKEEGEEYQMDGSNHTGFLTLIVFGYQVSLNIGSWSICYCSMIGPMSVNFTQVSLDKTYENQKHKNSKLRLRIHLLYLNFLKSKHKWRIPFSNLHT